MKPYRMALPKTWSGVLKSDMNRIPASVFALSLSIFFTDAADLNKRVKHGFADSNGVKIHYATLGKGPLDKVPLGKAPLGKVSLGPVSPKCLSAANTRRAPRITAPGC